MIKASPVSFVREIDLVAWTRDPCSFFKIQDIAISPINIPSVIEHQGARLDVRRKHRAYGKLLSYEKFINTRDNVSHHC